MLSFTFNLNWLQRNILASSGKILFVRPYFCRVKTSVQQECIPVGYVPSAAVAVSRGGGGVCPGVVSVQGRECLLRGVSIQGVTAQGVSAQGGCLPRGCLPKGGVCPGGCLPGTPTPVNRIRDRCKNITLPQLRCRR